MNPLIVTKPSKDGGRRMLTEECKATMAAWLEMHIQRWQAQISNGGYYTEKSSASEMTHRRHLLEDKIGNARLLQMTIDLAFDADAFDLAWRWVEEVMRGKPDDSAGSGPPGDAVGPC